jgi:hypothetical protein
MKKGIIINDETTPTRINNISSTLETIAQTLVEPGAELPKKTRKRRIKKPHETFSNIGGSKKKRQSKKAKRTRRNKKTKRTTKKRA